MAPPIIESQSIDQVGAILRGLDLDKKYFYKYVIPNAALKMSSSKSEADPLSPRVVEPTSPETAKAATTHAASSQPKEGDTKKAKSVMDKKANTKKGTTALSMAFKPQMDSADFDLYLAESLTPCLAQALDALGRELIRQKETGDKMDRNVLRRFNPRTWIAQYLLRNHPNACQTPRRTAVYADFRKWTDLERGRRELLRRRETITKCFKGFSKRSVVSASDIPKVWATLDEMWYLNGALKNHPQLAISYDGIAPNNLFTHDAFWTWFSQLVMANDILSFAAFKDGHARMLSELEQKEKAVLEAEQREEEEKLRAQQKEEERQRYVEVAEECKQNEILNMIIEKDMILTGAVSSLEPENKAVEVQPFGQHVILLSKLLIVLGFKSLPDPDFVQASRGNKAPTVSRVAKRRKRSWRNWTWNNGGKIRHLHAGKSFRERAIRRFRTELSTGLLCCSHSIWKTTQPSPKRLPANVRRKSFWDLEMSSQTLPSARLNNVLNKRRRRSWRGRWQRRWKRQKGGGR
jgi:hypothetical protein